jgi:F-type H+-transporting ATPase subunit delta
MAGMISTKRYAQAVMGIARQENKLEEWRRDLVRIGTVARVSEAVAFLEDSDVLLETKKALVQKVLPGLMPEALNLVYVLILRGKIKIAPFLALEYGRLVDSYNGLEHATITTAVPLDIDLREQIVGGLEDATGHKIVSETKVDPSIIGGIMVRIDGKLVDGSVRTRLAALRKSLLETAK